MTTRTKLHEQQIAACEANEPAKIEAYQPAEDRCRLLNQSSPHRGQTVKSYSIASDNRVFAWDMAGNACEIDGAGAIVGPWSQS